MYIKKTFKESGQEFCLVVNDIGEEFTWTKKTVKNSILDGIIQFEPPTDASKYPTSTNVAAIGAIGASYGITQYTFLDFSARVMYIPSIKWNLVNSEGTQHREWFSAKDMIYTNLMLGLRFEF